MRRAPALALAVAALAAAIFGDSVRNGFALDDEPLLISNPYLRDLGNAPRFFSSDYWAPTQASGLYRPLVTLSYALDRAVLGVSPAGHHAVNVALHALCSALVALLALCLFGDLRVAAMTGALFAAHAVHAEVAASVAGGRPELLAACFGLLSLLAYAGWRGEGASPRAHRLQLASYAAFAAALLCKESALAFAVGIPLVDWVSAEGGRGAPRVRDLASGRRMRVYAGYAIVALAVVGLRIGALGAEALPPVRPLDNPLAVVPVAPRIATALWVAVRYAGLLVFPLHLSYDYSYAQIPVVASVGDLRWLAGAAFVAAYGAFLAWAARRARAAFFAAAFSLAAFLPVSNAMVPIGTILAERLLYVPSIGFCLLVALALRAATRRATDSPRAASALLLSFTAIPVALHAARAFDRARDWRSESTLWLHDLRVAPMSAKVQSNAGAVLAEAGRHEEALGRFEAAIAIGPEGYAEPLRGAVLSLLALGRFEEAEAMYERAVRYGPRHPGIEEALRARRRP